MRLFNVSNSIIRQPPAYPTFAGGTVLQPSIGYARLHMAVTNATISSAPMGDLVEGVGSAPRFCTPNAVCFYYTTPSLIAKFNSLFLYMAYGMEFESMNRLNPITALAVRRDKPLRHPYIYDCDVVSLVPPWQFECQLYTS